MPPNLPVTDLLLDRATTHGDFDENARISQSLKDIFRDADGWDNLSFRSREALDQIALKISRILSGMSHPQHWEDIEGYARLALTTPATKD